MKQPVSSRTTSQDHPQAQAESFSPGANFYEAKITDLFLPWLVDEVPDGAWQTLQEKLGHSPGHSPKNKMRAFRMEYTLSIMWIAHRIR